jgi:hypothetical protein
MNQIKLSSTWGTRNFSLNTANSSDQSGLTKTKVTKKKRAKGEWRKKDYRDDGHQKGDIGYRDDDDLSSFRRYKSSM